MAFACALAAISGATPAESRIAQARSAVIRNPGFAEAHVSLAAALIERARETANPSFVGQAREAVEQALRLDPGNFVAQKGEVSVLLAEHDFAAALDKARVLNRRVPDDVAVWGFLTDADLALGQYAEAEKSCQWMLNLRPGNEPALLRVGTLREVFGELEGALVAFDLASQATPATEIGERAWIMTQVARIRFEQSKIKSAEQILAAALKLFPGYPQALGMLAQVRTAQGRFGEAVALQQQRYDSSPIPLHLFALAEALDRAGKREEAARAYAKFEGVAGTSLELALYYLDHANKPEQALRIAQREFEQRHDIRTLDVYARALSANGRGPEAVKQIDRALSVGTRDPEILDHARLIRSQCVLTKSNLTFESVVNLR